MSRYEMLDYDELLRRIGIQPDEPWYRGGNPADDASYNEVARVYDEVTGVYDGRNPRNIGGLCLAEDINVNGLTLNHRDLNGTIWLCTGMDGWWTLPPSDLPDVPKPFWDGSMLTTGRYLTRTITISGCFIPPDPALVWYNRDAILRCSAIVRGSGLLAVCGNETVELNHIETPDDPFLDVPKMALIQTADVPLIDTVRPNGFTQFQLQFRSVNPTKLSLYETIKPLKIEDTSGVKAVTRERRYKAFSLDKDEGGGATTEYEEVLQNEATLGTRRYSEVLQVNPDSPISDEELTASVSYDPTAYKIDESGGTSKAMVLHNAGNYFAFPTFVFGKIKDASSSKPVTVRNFTTNEVMQIVKPVPLGSELVVDTSMRRVGVVDPKTGAPAWHWDDRTYLSLTSQWISLAPGDNTILVTKSGDVEVPAAPRIYFRHTWIG